MSGQALTPEALFAFGKLPSHGDFVARGMDPAQQAAWDLWMTDGLDEARRTLADQFETRHDSAPAWRFTFPPAAFCPESCAGVLAASIDRSGRRFAIVLAARLGGDLPRAAAEALTGDLETALYWAFEEGAPIDALMARAAHGLPKPGVEVEPGEPTCRVWTVEPFSEIIAGAPTASLLARCLTGPEG